MLVGKKQPRRCQVQFDRILVINTVGRSDTQHLKGYIIEVHEENTKIEARGTSCNLNLIFLLGNVPAKLQMGESCDYHFFPMTHTLLSF